MQLHGTTDRPPLHPSPVNRKVFAVSTTVKLGTRGSTLARMQSQLIADAIESTHPGVIVELVVIRTGGDQVTDRPLADIGGKGLFTREIEQALLAGEIDLAVHSYKDVPVTQPLVDVSELVIAAVPPREDPRDALISIAAASIAQLPAGARIGTGSQRRRAQLLAIRDDLQILPIRGNIDTRLKKLQSGEFDAILLAMAGLKRSRLFDSTFMNALPIDQVLPAAAQGALALQCRSDDPATRRLLAALDDPATRRCVDAERRLVQLLDGDCHSPIAALAEIADQRFTLRAAVGGRNGELPVLTANASGSPDEFEKIVQEVNNGLQSQGARSILQSGEPG